MRIRDDRIVAFDKSVTLPECDIRAEWVGFARFSAANAARLAGAIGRYIEAGRVDAIYEKPMRDVILETAAFGFEGVTDLPWVEIDFPEDVRRTRAKILPRLMGLPREHGSDIARRGGLHCGAVSGSSSA
ncbi:MAG TPA: hypothetical protein VHK45_01975 [Geminicoccaceae bacterium]|nr:hypothetical protein [Geminicoccaceae bacterium]